MALILKDRVRETTTSTGTGSVTLAGAVTGFQSFAVIGNGNTCYYCISDQSGSNWEVGYGTYSTTGPTLARTIVLSSSNANALVNFGAGTKDVFVTQPASKAVYQQTDGKVGIGTDAPTTQLYVQTGVGDYGLAHTDGTRTFATYLDSDGVWVGADSNDPLILMQGSGEAMRIDTAQNVGIGTPTPTAKLDVNGSIKTNTQTLFYNSTVPTNDGWGVIECVDDGLGDSYNDLNIYVLDQYGTKYAPFFNAGVSSADFVIRSQDWTTNYHFVRLLVPSGMTGDYTLTLPSTSGSANQVLQTDGTGVTSWTNTFILGAGTATVAPLQLTSGTNLTTAAAGAIEYNGTAAFITGTAASGRGINLAPQMVRVNTDRAKATNNTTLEPVFDAANDVLALAANTLYYFKGIYVVTKSATGTAGGVQIGFAFSNAQQDIGYKSIGYATTGGNAQFSAYSTVITAITATPTATAATDYVVEIEGWFKSNATTGGTLTPQFTQSVVGTTVAPTMKANSWFMVQPMSGTPTTTLIAGNWS